MKQLQEQIKIHDTVVICFGGWGWAANIFSCKKREKPIFMVAVHCIRNSKQFNFHNPDIQNERRRPKYKQQMSALWGKPSIQQNIFLTKWIMNHWTLFTCINNLQVQIKPANPLHFQQMLMRSHSQKLHLAWQNVSFFVTSEVSPQFISCANRLRF